MPVPSHRQYRLLPVHPQPYRDELLSAWIERSAVRSGTDYRHFAARGFGLWTDDDIDRQLGAEQEPPADPPEPFKKRIAARMGQSEEKVQRLSLVKYAPRLYAEEGPERMQSRRPPWLVPFRKYTAANEAPPGRRYPYCPKCYPEPGEGYVQRIWRLAFIVACPVHGVWLRPAAGEKEDAPDAEEDLRGSDLLKAQMMMLGALFSGQAPQAFNAHRPTGEGPLPAGKFFAGLRVLVTLLSSRKKGFYPRAFVEHESGIDPRPDFSTGRTQMEMLSLAKRRYLMRLLAWVVAGWPKRYHKLCLRADVGKRSFGRYQRNVEGAGWLDAYLPSPGERPENLAEDEETDLGTHSSRLRGLSLDELLQLDPELEFQFGCVGLDLEEVKSAIPCEEDWAKVEDIFHANSSTRGTKGPIRYRTLFGLVILTLRREMPDAGMLPPVLARRVKSAFREWEKDGRLEEAFSRLPRSLDPEGLVDWTAERKRLEGKTWDASDHYLATVADEKPAASLSNGGALAQRRVFRKSGKVAHLRPPYFASESDEE